MFYIYTGYIAYYTITATCNNNKKNKNKNKIDTILEKEMVLYSHVSPERTNKNVREFR